MPKQITEKTMNRTARQWAEEEATLKARKASDTRIYNALQVLQSHYRGRMVLAGFKMMSKSATGLDAAGLRSLIIITEELAAGRRDFLLALPELIDVR